MNKTEKVIKGLECCRDRIKDDLSQTNEPCDYCPYAENGNACSPWELYDDTLELLKEQEAKTPVECEHDGYWYYTCPTCGNHEELFREWNYCPFCGQAVKWDSGLKEGKHMTNREAFNEYLREKLRKQVAELESANNQRLVELLKEWPELQIRVDVGRELNYFMYTNLHGKPRHWKGAEDQVRWLDMEKRETWDD